VIMISAVDMWTTRRSRRNIHAQPVDNLVDKSVDLRFPPVDNLCYVSVLIAWLSRSMVARSSSSLIISSCTRSQACMTVV